MLATCYEVNIAYALISFVVVRTLTGHKMSIRGLDFHPYGDFVASGSVDTNIKVCLTSSLNLVKPQTFSHEITG